MKKDSLTVSESSSSSTAGIDLGVQDDITLKVNMNSYPPQVISATVNPVKQGSISVEASSYDLDIHEETEIAIYLED